MSSLRVVACLSSALLLASTAHAQDPAHLNEILRQMDASSLKFKSAEADFRKELYQRVVRDTTTQTGSIYFLKSGNSLQMGAIFAPPESKIVEYKDGRLRLFDPGSNQLTVKDSGSNQAQYESFLTLGFGGSGKDLEKTWTITDQGSTSLNDGSADIKVEKLDLVAKSPDLRNSIAHVTIWVDPTRAISLKQEFFFTSEDTQTAFYTHIRYNEPVNTRKYAIKADGKKSR